MARALFTLGLAALLALLVASLEPSFLSSVNLGNLSRQVGLHGLLALGAGVVMLTGGIDLSVGSVAALSGLIFARMFHESGGGVAGPFAAAIGTGLLIGLVQGGLIAGFRVPPFVVTLCGLLIVRGATRYLTEDQAQGLGAGDPTLTSLVEGRWLGVANPLWLFLGTALAASVVLHRTVLGRHLFALGSQREAARLAGVRIRSLEVLAYAWSGLLAGGTGVLFLVYSNSLQPASAGVGLELAAIAAAVLGGVSLRGGVGTVLGMVAGVLLLRLLVNATSLLRVPTYLEGAVSGVAILLGALLDAGWRSARVRIRR